jgi:hypothetical protein
MGAVETLHVRTGDPEGVAGLAHGEHERRSLRRAGTLPGRQGCDLGTTQPALRSSGVRGVRAPAAWRYGARNETRAGAAGAEAGSGGPPARARPDRTRSHGARWRSAS